jgi:8-oxo-dGTP pyrophosphatase MutT (NUDIX family)
MKSPWTEAERRAYVEGLPRKRIVASLAAFHEGRLLLVKPTYREGWLLPGGVVEADESPAEGCVRECREELSLDLPLRGLLLVDYAPDPKTGGGDSLHFWFSTDELSAAQVEAIVLPADELGEYRLATPREADTLLIPRMAARLRTYLAHRGSGMTVLSEAGRVAGLG